MGRPMIPQRSLSQSRLIRSGIAILAAGLSLSLYVFLSRTDEAEPMLELQSSKKFVREVELYGGKANLVAIELTEAIASVWHGRSLAYVIAVVSLGAAAGCLYAASRDREEE